MNPFQNVLVRKPKKSLFDLSHERKLTANHGWLYPVFCEEVMPGDKFQVNSELLVRCQPLVTPAMQRIDVYTHFFFVPNRLIWDKWEKFITQGVQGTDAPVLPYVYLNRDETAPGTLADYMGVQISAGMQTDYTPINALPFAAFQKIVDDYYIDQTLNSGANMEGYQLIDGDNTATNKTALMSMRLRCWEKDYFTSAMPWAQRGGDVRIPMADIEQAGATNVQVSGKGYAKLYNGNDTVAYNVPTLKTDSSGYLANDSTNFLKIEPQGLSVNIPSSGSVEAGTIEELRRASKLQVWLEKAMRGGSRYYEQIKMFFGVTVPDFRLQRAEYLGGGKSPVVISEVLQTNASPDTGAGYITPQGNMAGHGVSVGRTHSFRSFFPEHGYVIGIMSILPRSAYMGGIRRMFLKKDNFDFAFPDFAQLGEQPVWMGELFGVAGSNAGSNWNTFGYQQRYAEYKYIPSLIHGNFRSEGNLPTWTLARHFDQAPVLNNSFVKYDTDERIFAVTDETVDKYLVNIYHNVRAIRPLPYYNEPTLL